MAGGSFSFLFFFPLLFLHGMELCIFLEKVRFVDYSLPPCCTLSVHSEK